MQSNYRLPLKHFENRNWKEAPVYNRNRYRLTLIPLLAMGTLLLLIICVSYGSSVVKYKVQDIVLTPNNNGTINYDNCPLSLESKDKSYIWSNSQCTNPVKIIITPDKTQEVKIISSNPLMYITGLSNNVNLINSDILLEGIMRNSNDYISLSNIPNSQQLEIYNNCQNKDKCWLIRKLDNKTVEIVNKSVLTQLTSIANFKSLELQESNNQLYILQNTSEYSNKYLLDLPNKSIIKQ
jgi:hypothetical protein